MTWAETHLHPRIRLINQTNAGAKTYFLGSGSFFFLLPTFNYPDNRENRLVNAFSTNYSTF